MAKLTLVSGHNNALPVVIRDQKLNEVWRGILQEKQELDLADGHYLMEINGLEGRKQVSFQSQGVDQSIAIGDDQPAQAFESLEIKFEQVPPIEIESLPSGAGTHDHSLGDNTIKPVIAEAGVRLETISEQKVRRNLQRAVASQSGDSRSRSTPTSSSSTRRSRRAAGGRHRKKNSQLVAMWSKEPDSDWELNSAPKLDQIFSKSPLQRFLRISGPDRLPVLVAMPNQVESISISIDPRRTADVLITEPDTNVMALRAMMERHEHREAALMAAALAKTDGAELPGAAQVALVLASLLAELQEGERPNLGWFKNLAFASTQLADPLVAYAWYGTYLDLLDEDQIARALTKSVACGVPRLTMSLQLLHRGLELLSYEGADTSVFSARETVRRWVDRLQADTFFTTFVDSGQHILMNSSAHSEPARTGALLGVSIDRLNAQQEEGFLTIEL